MTVKLNLTIEEEVVKRTKRFAKKQNLSVSKFVQKYLDEATQNEKPKEESFVEKFGGKFKLGTPDIKNAKKEYLKEKYGY